jgi:hypothetical protein
LKELIHVVAEAPPCECGARPRLYPPRVQERVFCTVPNGALNYAGSGKHKVYGTLHVTLKRDISVSPPQVVEVFHLDAERVEPDETN